MVSIPRWGGLRIEPYDPRPRDADLDQIVQEGTAWERPAGTRLLDELGRPIIEGATSAYHIRGISYIDRNGKTVEYRASTLGDIQAGTPALQRLGYPSLTVMGHESVGQRAANAHRSDLGAVAPSEFDALEAAGAFETKFEKIPDEVVFVEAAVKIGRAPLPYEVGIDPNPLSSESERAAIIRRQTATKDSIKTKFKKLFGLGDADSYPSSIDDDSLDKPATIKSSVREDLLWRRRKKTDTDINPQGLADDLWIGKDGNSISRREILQSMMNQAGVNSPEELVDWVNGEAERRRTLDFENAHTARTIISVPSRDLETIVKDGHYKSQAERAADEGSDQVSSGSKQAIEEAQMGVPVDLNVTQRPIYGHKDVSGEGESLGDLPGASYSDREGGGFHLVLKETANAATTVSFGDTANTGVIPTGSNTLDEHRLDLADAGSKVVDHHASEVLSELQQAALSDLSAENSDDIAEVLGDKLKIVHPDKFEYWEAQVHGGVNISDVDMLVIPDGLTASERFSPEMLKTLRANGTRIVSASDYANGTF